MRTGISRLIAAFTGFPFSSGGASQRPDWFSTHPSIVAIPESGRGVSETPRRLHMASRPAQPPPPSPGRQPSYSGRSGALAHGSPVWRALEPVSGRVQGLATNTRLSGSPRTGPGSDDIGPENPADIFLRKDAVRSGFSGGREHHPRASSARSTTREHPHWRVASRRFGGCHGGYPLTG